MGEIKICNKCKLEKEISLFYSGVRKNGWKYVDSICIKCKALYFKNKNLEKYIGVQESVENLEGEIWVPILEVGFEGLYEISNFSRVKSLPNSARPIEKIMTPQIQRNGRVSIWMSSKGVEKNCQLHRLVAKAFIPNPENKPCVNHIDNNPLNNQVRNLEWCTYKENSQHALKCNRFQLGEQRHNCKFTNEQVLEIFHSSIKITELAKIYNASIGAIRGIKNGRNWSHITGKKYVK